MLARGWTSVAAEDAADDGVQPSGDLVGDAAELHLELEGLALSRLGEGSEDLGGPATTRRAGRAPPSR